MSFQPNLQWNNIRERQRSSSNKCMRIINRRPAMNSSGIIAFARYIVYSQKPILQFFFRFSTTKLIQWLPSQYLCICICILKIQIAKGLQSKALQASPLDVLPLQNVLHSPRGIAKPKNILCVLCYTYFHFLVQFTNTFSEVPKRYEFSYFLIPRKSIVFLSWSLDIVHNTNRRHWD